MLRSAVRCPYGRVVALSKMRFQSTVATNGKDIVSDKPESIAEDFSVFPSIKEVKLEDVVGHSSFGNRTYYVERSATGNLPVYSEYKGGGGNKMVTEIRKIQGDIIQLRNDLQEKLPYIPKDNWKVMMQSKKILINGNAVEDVKKVLSTTF